MSKIERVHFLMTDAPRPVFHKFDTVVRERDYADKWVHVAVMACGAKTGQNWWNATIRRAHAELFGRPCSRCFPVRDGSVPASRPVTSPPLTAASRSPRNDQAG